MTSVSVANVPHFLTPNEAEDDLELALMLGRVLLLCEMDRSNDAALATAVRRTGRTVRVWFRRKRTQVVTPDDLRGVGWYRTLTPGKHGVNPPRGMAVVEDHETRTIYVSVHLPNGKRNRTKVGRAWREWAWNRYQRKVAREVGRWLAAGWNVVLGGDINDRRGLILHPDQVTAVHAGLMWLIAIPAPGHVVQVRDTQTVTRNHGDHSQIRADIRFTERHTR